MDTLLILAVAENPLLRFGVNWYDFASQAIAFLIIAWILNKFVFKTVMKTVAERQRAADEALANNARIKQELEAVENARKEALRNAQEQAEKMMSEAKASIAEMIHGEKQRAERLGAEMMAQTREDARLEQIRMRTELRDDLALLIVDLTAKLTRMNLTAADRDRLHQSAIQEMIENQPK